MNKKKDKSVIFVCTEEFKTNKENMTEEELVELFNQKFYQTIMKMEKNITNHS